MTGSESNSEVDLLLVATIRILSSLMLFLLGAMADLMGFSLGRWLVLRWPDPRSGCQEQ